MLMAKPKKVPENILQFKTKVEETGLFVSFSYSKTAKDWQVNVLTKFSNVMRCIWHNDCETKNLDIELFWKSKAWKSYENDKAKI